MYAILRHKTQASLSYNDYNDEGLSWIQYSIAQKEIKNACIIIIIISQGVSSNTSYPYTEKAKTNSWFSLSMISI